MPDLLLAPGRETELLALIARPGPNDLTAATCRGRSPDDYHPEVGEPADEAAELRKQGKTINQIAQALGRSRRTVQRYLNGTA